MWVERELDAYLDAGYDLVPLDRRAKEPRDKGWTSRDYGREELRVWARGGGNVGVRLRSDQLVLDGDPRNYPPGRDVLAELCKDVGLDPASCPSVRTGSGGTHLYLGHDGSPVPSKLPGYPGVDFKSVGFQVVAAGSLHPSGKVYERDDFGPVLGEEPPTPAALLERFAAAVERKTAEGLRETGRVPPEMLATLLGHLDPLAYREHDDWLALMMSCVAATAGEGVEEFIAWSISDPKYATHGETIRKRWASISPDGPVTEATLYAAVFEAGGAADLPPLPIEPAELGDLGPAEGKPEATRVLEDLNDRYAVVTVGSSVRVYCDVFNAALDRDEPKFMAAADFALREANLPTIPTRTPQNKPTRRGAAAYWLGWKRRRQFRSVAFAPQGAPEGVLNLYRGFGVDPAPGDWSLVREELLPALFGKHAGWALRWLAQSVQRPWELPEVALVLKGPEAAGKGTLGRAFCRLHGQHGLHLMSHEDLVGRFSSHLARAVAVFADEAVWAGDHAGDRTLRGMITEPTRMYEQKGIDKVEGLNCTHLMMASNEDWVVPVGHEGRRFAAFDVDPGLKEEHGFFPRANAQLRNGGLGGMLHDLLTVDIEGWHPRDDKPRTSALADQMVETLKNDPVAAWWIDRLQEGDLPGLTAEDWRAGRVRVWSETLQGHFLGSTGGRASTRFSNVHGDKIRLGRFLTSRRVGGSAFREVVPDDTVVDTDAKGRAKCYHFPDLDTCRRRFLPNLEWGEEEEEW